MTIAKDGQAESYSLVNLKKWNFSNPILSLITFDQYNKNNDPSMNRKGLGAGYSFGTSGLKSVKSVNSGLGSLSSSSNQTF